jgi:FixJ family two-component response regulator
MKPNWTLWILRSVGQCLLGSIAVALLTFVGFRLHIGLTIAALFFLIIVVLLSITGGFVPSIFTSVIAVLCLDYFFATPLFSLELYHPLDVVTLVTFLTIASVISLLMLQRQRFGAALRESEQRHRADQAEQALHESQLELARVTRVMTLGEMTASIAHEINQPLAGVVTNGQAALRLWRNLSVHPAGIQGRRVVKKKTESVVYVIDDDSSIRESLSSLIRSVGLSVETFATAQDFLRSERPDVPACVVLDVRLPGLSGLDLQREMSAHAITLPVIFITGHGDIPMSVRAMKAGALEFLTKPFRDQDLLDAVQEALDRARVSRQQQSEIAELRDRFNGLTTRESEVLGLVAAGLLNKQIAGELGVSEITVKIHRGQVMKKMGAGSVAELVRMTERLGIPAAKV